MTQENGPLTRGEAHADSTPTETSARLTHLDESGRANMVDVSDKPPTTRVAIARARVLMRPQTLSTLRDGSAAKGDVLAVARIAGIMAAKQTSSLIPLCHALPLSKVGVRFAYLDAPAPAVLIEAVCKTTAPTGVEMEALVAVQLSAATIYDMLKGVDRELVISDVYLVHKSGGRSGEHRGPHQIPGVDEDALVWR